MRIVITGAAGLVGRNLLFEFIRQYLDRLGSLEIFILGRSNGNADIHQRIEHILLEDGADYLSLPADRRHILQNYCRTGIHCVETDLGRDDLGMKAEDLARLQSGPIDYFYHVAALTDLRNAPGVAAALRNNNVQGTLRVLRLAHTLDIGEFCFVGTAYACGTTSGRIMPDYVQLDQEFRNPYELSKLQAEMAVREFAARTNVRCRYFRPSIICGRLIEPPLGGVHKFDVFYASAAALLRMKLKVLQYWMDKYRTPARLEIRVCCDLAGGLNIVPADYVAKTMYQACAQGDPGESYHLVNDQVTSNEVFLGAVQEALNISGLEFVEHMPERLTALEALYYRTVGRIYTPYIMSLPMDFDTQSLQNVLTKSGLRCPPVDRGQSHAPYGLRQKERFWPQHQDLI